MHHRLRHVAAVVTGAALLVPGTAAAAKSCGRTGVLPSNTDLPALRSATLCLLNVQRTERGLKPLTLNADLGAASNAYSRLMVSKHFFDHVSPSGSTLSSRVKRTGYLDGASGWALGENIAWGTGPLGTAGEIVDSWMHSAGHRANILEGHFTEIGIGIAYGAPRRGAGPAATYTTDFGART